VAYATGSLNLCQPRMGEGLDAGSLSFAKYDYISADPVLTVIGAGYIDDGNDKGIRVNDVVCVVDNNLGLVDLCIVTVVTAAGLVTMVNGT